MCFCLALIASLDRNKALLGYTSCIPTNHHHHHHRCHDHHHPHCCHHHHADADNIQRYALRQPNTPLTILWVDHKFWNPNSFQIFGEAQLAAVMCLWPAISFFGVTYTPHPHLETNYTGNERTHGWNIFCWPFLTETKREWPFSGHFQSKFLLGALHFALCFFDPKFYDFWGKNRAGLWLNRYSWTWIDLTNVSGVKLW